MRSIKEVNCNVLDLLFVDHSEMFVVHIIFTKGSAGSVSGRHSSFAKPRGKGRGSVCNRPSDSKLGL